MTLTIHPKTSAAALGGSAGIVLVAVLGSIHGVHLSPEANAAIPTFLATLGAFLSPSPADPAPATNPPQIPAEPLSVPASAPSARILGGGPIDQGWGG